MRFNSAMDIFETVDDFRKLASHSDLSSKEVSSWSIGTHLHHCCLVMIGVCKLLKKITRPAPPVKWSLIKSLVFFTKFIPRGRARAPEVTIPRAEISQSELEDLLDHATNILREALEVDQQSWFNHPIFGVLKRDQSIEFLRIHNLHHLKIIRAILKVDDRNFRNNRTCPR